MPSLVRAESMVHIPGDPLTKHGLRAAAQWATDEFREKPACRLVFASGHAHRWFEYQSVSRKVGESPVRDYAVAIEVAVTDAQGRRFVQSIPIDAKGVEEISAKRDEERRKRYVSGIHAQYDWFF